MDRKTKDRIGDAFIAYRAGNVDAGYMVRALTGEHRSAHSTRTQRGIRELLDAHFPGQYAVAPSGALVPR